MPSCYRPSPAPDRRLRRAAAPALALALALHAGAARAHETLHEIARDRAIAVRATHGDGRPLALATYQVFSPADPGTPRQEGRTDRDGWLAFVPDASGTWRVRVFDRSGHGLDLRVDAEAPATARAPTGDPTGPAAASPPPAAPPPTGGPTSSAALLLRPLAGLAVIGAVFATLFVTYRRKEAGKEAAR